MNYNNYVEVDLTNFANQRRQQPGQFWTGASMIPTGIGMQNRGGFLQGASSATAELENAIASSSGTSTNVNLQGGGGGRNSQGFTTVNRGLDGILSGNPSGLGAWTMGSFVTNNAGFPGGISLPSNGHIPGFGLGNAARSFSQIFKQG